MVFPNVVHPPKLHQHLLPPPTPAGSTRGKDHRLKQEQFTENSKEIKKLTIVATTVITKVYKEKEVYMQNAHQTGHNEKHEWTDPLSAQTFP